MQINGTAVSNGACSYWDPDKGIILNIYLIKHSMLMDKLGAWSSSGSRKVKQDDSHTVCEFKKLGHFGILFVSDSYASL